MSVRAENSKDKAKLTGLCAGLIVLYAGLTIFYYIRITAASSEITIPFGGDFINIWLAGKLALAGKAAVIYDFPAYLAVQQEYFGPLVEPRTFPYPPFVLPFIIPFGLMPFTVAYVVWFVVTFVMLAVSLRALGIRGKMAIIMLALSPACYLNVMAGQYAFVTAALFVGALAQLGRRPLMAGALFGLLTCKPHLGVLVPVALALRREWRVFIVAALVTLALPAAGALMFGMDVVTGYFTGALSYQAQVLQNWDGLLQMMMPSGYAAAQILGVPEQVGYAVSLVMAAAALAAVVVVWRRNASHALRSAVLLCAAPAALPYVFVYDMVLTAVAVLMLYPYVRGRTERTALLALWLSPLAIVILNYAGLPFGPIALLAGVGLSVRCALRESHSAALN